MDDRRSPEALVAVPAGRLRKCEVDLHLGAPVAESLAALGNVCGQVAVEQPPVELGRRHVGDHGSRRRNDLAVSEPDTARLAPADDDLIDIPARLADAAVLADQRHERVDELRAAAAGDRHPAFLDRDRDHLRHEPGGRGVGAEPGVEHPWGEQPVGAPGGEVVGQPVAARGEDVAGELDQAAGAEPAEGLDPEPEALAGPELGAEDAECEIGRREKAVENPTPGIAVSLGVAVELGRVRIGVAEQERRLAVGVERRGGMAGVQVLEPVRSELVGELGVSGASDPQRVPGTEDVVEIPGLGQLRGLDRAAEGRAPLEHADVPPAPCEQGGTGERVDPAADDDRVVVSHRRALGTRRR